MLFTAPDAEGAENGGNHPRRPQRTEDRVPVSSPSFFVPPLAADILRVLRGEHWIGGFA
jgi:hypothetical protein